MKRLQIISLLLIAVLLVGCIASSPGSNSGNCLKEKEYFKLDFCIELKAERDFLQDSESSLPFTITVTSANDMPEFVIQFVGSPDNLKSIQFSDPKSKLDQYGILRGFSIKANETLVYHGTIDLTGKYDMDVLVYLGLEGSGMSARDSFTVVLVENGWQVYYPQRSVFELPPSVPTSRMPPALTSYSITYTPGATPTWAPSPTWLPHFATQEALTQQAAKTPEPVQTQKP